MVQLLFSLLLAFSSTVDLSPASDFVLPKTWGKKFQIAGYQGGGLLDEDVRFTYTYDSSIYMERSGTTSKRTAIAITEAQRIEILKKLEEYQVGTIRSQKPSQVKLEAASSSVCFTLEETICLSELELQPKDRGNYFGAYAYLLQFAKQQGTIKK